MLRKFVVGAAVGLVVASAAGAQTRPSRKAVPVPVAKRFSLGAYTVFASGVTVLGPDIDGPFRTSLGQGVGVQVGYTVTPRAMVFASVDVARQPSETEYIAGSMGLSHIEVGGRMTFPTARKRLVPYATAVIGKRTMNAADGYFADLDQSFSLKMSGMELGAGGGVLYSFSPALALDAGLILNRGKLNKANYTGDINERGTLNVNSSTSMRLKVGFQWTPRK
jgi:hypothetical protein